jgi:WD40 repeat protein
MGAKSSKVVSEAPSSRSSFERMASVRDYFTARITPLEDVAPPAPPLVVVLRGHTKFVTDVVELADSRIASASEDRTIRVWSLAEDGTADGKPDVLSGHTDAVRCLVALKDGRLASGSRDKTVRIWDISENPTPPIVLKGHEGYVWKLAELADGRLASGSWDKTIRIWDLSGAAAPLVVPHGDAVRGMLALKDGRLATGGGKDGMINVWNVDSQSCTKALELASHPKYVAALAELPGQRLAAGGGDAGRRGEGFHIRIFDLNDGPHQAPKVLRGRADVWSLVTLDDGRLAAGGPDGVRVWDLDNEERRPIGFAGQATVDGMASLKDGTLASGGDDGTIRVHRVKTYEYYREILRVTEDVARKWFAEDRLGELFDASVLQYDELLTIDDDDAPTGLGAVASRAVVTQARNLDAIATTLKSAPASRRDACIDDLAPRVLRLVKDEELLLTFEQRLVSKSAVEQLTPSPLFRVVLNFKFVAGPRFVLWLDILLFALLFLSFSRLTIVDSAWKDEGQSFAGENKVEIILGFIILTYFSLREVLNVYYDRKRELAVRHSDARNRFFKLFGQAKLPPLFTTGPQALRSLGRILVYVVTGPLPWLQKISLIPRVVLSIVAVLLFLPLSCLPGRSVKAFVFGVVPSILYNTLSLLGLPRAWRSSLWNWIEVTSLVLSWTAFARAAMSRIPVNLAVATALFLWIEVFDYLRYSAINEELAAFVLMIGQILLKLAVFMFVFVLILMMFTNLFFLRLGNRSIRPGKYFDLHDDEPNYLDHPFNTLLKSFYSVLLLAFAQEFDPDIFHTTIDRVIFVFYLFIIVIVLLNVLIAIVNSQYADTSARATKLFYRGRFELVAETSDFLRMLPRRRNIHSETIQQVAAMIKREVNRGTVRDAIRGEDLKEEVLRIQRETDAKLLAMQSKMDAILAAVASNNS